MATKALRRRLEEVRRAGQAEEVGRIVIIAPDNWPEKARDAYDAECAARDQLLQADIIEAHTGRRPVFPAPELGPIRGRLPPVVIEVRYGPDESQRW